MTLCWSEQAWEDYLFWQASDKAMLKRINHLIRDIERDPFRGAYTPPTPSSLKPKASSLKPKA